MSTNDESNTYHADHELAMRLKDASLSGERLRVQTGNTLFEIEGRLASAHDPIWEGYDAQAARAAWHAMTRMLPDIDADALIEEIRRDRA